MCTDDQHCGTHRSFCHLRCDSIVVSQLDPQFVFQKRLRWPVMPKRCILCFLPDGVQAHHAHVRYQAVDELLELHGSGHYPVDPIDNVSAWTIDQSMRKGRVVDQCGLVFAVSTLICGQQPCVSRITCNTHHLQHAAPHARSVRPRSRQVPAFSWLVFVVGQAQVGRAVVVRTIYSTNSACAFRFVRTMKPALAIPSTEKSLSWPRP